MHSQGAFRRQVDTQPFTVQVEKLQDQLDQLRARARTAPEATLQETDEDAVALARLAREILRFRRRRDHAFEGELFGEPAWDILLELYSAECADEKLSVSSVCFASGVPQTTALRHISKLERKGWVERLRDPLDGRRYWLLLSEKASQAMRAYLAKMTLRLV